MTTISISPQEQRRWLEKFLSTPAVRTRTDVLQRTVEHAIRLAVGRDEIAVGMLLWAVSACHLANKDRQGVEALLSVLIKSHEDGTIREVLNARIEEIPDRKCRMCGCTDGKACPDGCRWVEWDLCSRCATYPYPACMVCDAPAPRSIEAAYAAGWNDGGLCPGCEHAVISGLEMTEHAQHFVVPSEEVSTDETHEGTQS